jgi:hypothetical protein
MARELRFRLTLTRDQAMLYYQGAAKAIVVTAENGQRIQFPAEHIRPFIDHLGVNGVFKIEFDANNKLLGLKRIS